MSSLARLSYAHTTPSLRARCQGELPLSARLEGWMEALLDSSDPFALVERYGSPLNVLDASPFTPRIASFQQTARDRQLDFRIFYARKANKCLRFVDHALEAGAGIDSASETEIRQARERGATGDDLICTAAIKDGRLLRSCLEQGVTIAVDNLDEWQQIEAIARATNLPGLVAIRLGGFLHEGRKLATRFGFDVEMLSSWIATMAKSPLRVTGLHFHLDGPSVAERVSAIAQSLRFIDAFRRLGQPVRFLDIGGGIPVRYIDSSSQWSAFCKEHRRALRHERPPITFDNHGLGQFPRGAGLGGRFNVYPPYQALTGSDWLANLLDAPLAAQTVSRQLIDRQLQLRCEPGRSLLDGCGLTLARVAFCKPTASGDWLIGLSMNHTQCRTTHDEFMVDPLVIARRGETPATASPPRSGFLVGAYCTESEFLAWRRLRFPCGIERGDLVVFPNTAGYLMHFMESRGHQFPLAANLIREPAEAPTRYVLDPIDRPPQS